ncbi:MAG: hypothetical protein ACYC09_06395 [Bacteroidota bacterium]
MSMGYVMLMSAFISCSPDLPVFHDDTRVTADRLPSPYVLLFIIHGDGDYLYHDADGNAYLADTMAVAGAKMVAEKNPQAEVFIFHQMKRRTVFFFFSRPDGKFYHYRNGAMVTQEFYWRNNDTSRFDPEVLLYHRLASRDNHERIDIVLYFGHEIPEFGGQGYDRSHPDRSFTLHDFAAGLNGFLRQGPCDLLILSTCNGGTPYTIGTLGRYARNIIASPGDLHLSYFDLRPLERLEIGLQNGDIRSFARLFARRSFDRLAGDIHTAVTVAVYDVDKVQGYLRSVMGRYQQMAERTIEATKELPAKTDQCDCAELSDYAMPGMSEGVEVFFRPARFGRSQYVQHHSGWLCTQKKVSKETTAQNSGSHP